MDQDPSEVRQAIEQDRTELADTVQALARKTDVKGRVREAVSTNANELRQKASGVLSGVRDVTPAGVQAGVGAAADSMRERPLPFSVGAAFALGLLLGLLWSRNR